MIMDNNNYKKNTMRNVENFQNYGLYGLVIDLKKTLTFLLISFLFGMWLLLSSIKIENDRTCLKKLWFVGFLLVYN